MTAASWRAGAVTDPGLERSINEDRVFVDEARGIFLVVDGLGGHAAGETAAETAVKVIQQELRQSALLDEEKLRAAITAANNEIHRLAEENPAWRGMACVLTLAVAASDQIVVGHVGDSRLYMYWNGRLKKITNDHSPVGELEDAGQLTEEQAMNHPRRNEVFRDVGSYQHTQGDADFIETKRFVFRADSALLLCSDGLSDYVNSADISRILEQYDGNAERTARMLIEAANAAGGRDNISAIFVPGPGYAGHGSAAYQEARARHATTRMRTGNARGGRGWLRNVFLIIFGMLIGLGVWRVVADKYLNPPPPQVNEVRPHAPQEIVVAPGDAMGLRHALAAAEPGDTIAVSAGEYLGPLNLKDRVNIIAQAGGKVIVKSDPGAESDAGVAILARNVKEARVKGLYLTGDETHPLRYGVYILNSSIQVEGLEVTGASDAGVRIEGDSRPLIVSGTFKKNEGVGVAVKGASAPRLIGNRIEANGRVEGARHAGMEIDNEAQPQLEHNDILDNGLPCVFPPELDKEIRANNSVDSGPLDKKKRPGAKQPLPPARPHPTTTKPASTLTQV